MCVLFIYVNRLAGSGKYRLILASNRDESFLRPAEAANFWANTDVLAGKDLTPGKAEGTWLGVSRNGRVGVLLNDARGNYSDREGRGPLVIDYLQSQKTTEDYMKDLLTKCKRYNPFFLVSVDMKDNNSTLNHLSNLDQKIVTLQDGVYGFCNNSLDKPFNKSKKGKELLSEVIKKYAKTTQSKNALAEKVLQILKNTEHNIPDEEYEKQFTMDKTFLPPASAIKIILPESHNYGTRTHTVILVDGDDQMDFYEWQHDTDIKSPNHFSLKIY